MYQLIPHERLPKGVRLCINNATRLIHDANLLHENKRFPSAIVSSTIAYEEIGKAAMLCDKWINNEDVTDDDWRRMRNHIQKSISIGKLVSKQIGIKVNGRDEKLGKDVQRIQETLVESIAETRSGVDKESYLYVNWSRWGWTYPEIPRSLIPDGDGESQMQAFSTIAINETEIALAYFLRDNTTQQVLAQPEIDSITFEDVTKTIRSKLNRSVKSVGITQKTQDGKIHEITVTGHESPLSKEEKKVVRDEIFRLLPNFKPNRLHFKP